MRPEGNRAVISKNSSPTSRRLRTLAGVLSAGMLVSGMGLSHLANAEDWPQFLGPRGDLTSTETSVPTSWSDTENVKWKVSLPGPGVSSPIVIGDKVFVTSYSGYGTGGANEKIEDLKRHLVCINRNTGATIWTKTINAVMPEDTFSPPGVSAHGYASNTPASDGEFVYIFMGKSGVAAFDLDGIPQWTRMVGNGSGPMKWGSAASPILYGDLLIVTASDESSSIIAFDKSTGEEKWRASDPALEMSWSTPVVVGEGDAAELVINLPEKIAAFDLKTGAVKWSSHGIKDNNSSSSIVPGDGVVFAIGGESVAVKTGGSGDVDGTHVVWDAQIPGSFSTAILHEGHLYTYASGVVASWNAATGERVAQQRLGAQQRGGRGGGGRDYASPVLVDGKLYVTKNAGEVYVLEATPELKMISTNKLSGGGGFGGTPAISNGQIIIRSGNTLYCIDDA